VIKELEFIEGRGMRLPLTQLGHEIAIHLLENTMYVCYTSVKGKPFCHLAVHSVCKRYTKVHLYWVPCMA